MSLLVYLLISVAIAFVAGAVGGYIVIETIMRRGSCIKEVDQDMATDEDLFPSDPEDVREQEKKKERGFFG